MLEIGVSFKSSDSKQKLIDKVTHARSSLNITRPIDGTTHSTSELVHAQDNSLEISQARDVNSALIDFNNHGSGSRKALSSETQVNFSNTFLSFSPALNYSWHSVVKSKTVVITSSRLSSVVARTDADQHVTTCTLSLVRPRLDTVI